MGVSIIYFGFSFFIIFFLFMRVQSSKMPFFTQIWPKKWTLDPNISQKNEKNKKIQSKFWKQPPRDQLCQFLDLQVL